LLQILRILFLEFFFLLLPAFNLFAARSPLFNNIQGPVFGSWKKEDSPIILQGNITIPSGQTLTIEPGVTIRVGGHYSTINVFGQLVARGTRQNPIKFISNHANPNKWDWDRINFRSRQRSFLEHCIIKHSNYAVYCINSAVSMDTCTFAENSIHALYVNNSTVDLFSSLIEGGHILAIVADKGAELSIKNSTIVGNINGLGCDRQSTVKLEKTLITDNHKGVVYRHPAALSLQENKVIKNRVGLMADSLGAVKKFPGFYDNKIDIVRDTSNELTKIFTPPAEVKTISVKKTGEEQIKEVVGGLEIVKRQKKNWLDAIGNVTAGGKFNYFLGTSYKKNIGLSDKLFPDKSQLAIKDPLITDTLPSSIFPGFQPEIKIFLTGKQGLMDYNFSADLYYNAWDEFQPNAFNLIMNFPHTQSFNIGEFFVDNTELSISNRKVRGIKYQSHYGQSRLERSTPLLQVVSIIGQSERPLDLGAHKLNSFGDTITNNLGTYQQLLGVVKLSGRPLLGLEISGGILEAYDVHPSSELGKAGIPLIRSINTGSSVSAIDNQTIFTGFQWQLIQNLKFKGELNTGITDTVNDASQESFFTNFMEKWSEGIGFNSKIRLYSINGNFVSTGRQYYTGGNPYLTKDMYKSNLSVDGMFKELLETRFSHEWRREDKSFELSRTLSSQTPSINKLSTPKDIHNINLTLNVYLDKRYPQPSLDYLLYYDDEEEWSSDTLYEISGDSIKIKDPANPELAAIGQKGKIRHALTLTLSQDFLENMNLKLKGVYRITDDNTKYINFLKKGKDDESRWQVNADVALNFLKKFKLKMGGLIRIKKEPNDKDQFDEQFEGRSKLSVEIIKRKLRSDVSFKYRRTNNYDYYHKNSNKTKVINTYLNSAMGLKYSLSYKYTLNFNLELDQINKPLAQEFELNSDGSVKTKVENNQTVNVQNTNRYHYEENEDGLWEPKYRLPEGEIKESYRAIRSELYITYSF